MFYFLLNYELFISFGTHLWKFFGVLYKGRFLHGGVSCVSFIAFHCLSNFLNIDIIFCLFKGEFSPFSQSSYIDGWTDGRMDGWIDEQVDGGWMDGWTMG